MKIRIRFPCLSIYFLNNVIIFASIQQSMILQKLQWYPEESYMTYETCFPGSFNSNENTIKKECGSYDIIPA